ncbi:leukosialin [Candoia aspera]|uniref:leukosialin n=1 Tax=Candoia aspera TaxID=51853 RepID=UPI002FD7DFEC
MEKSRSLFQQISGYKMLFVFFLLFKTGIPVDGQNTSQLPSTTNVTNNTETTESLSANSSPLALLNSTIFPNVSMPSVRSLPDATISSTLAPSMSITTTVHQAVALRTKPPVSKQEIIQSPTAVIAAAPEDTSIQKKSSTPVLDNVTSSTKEKILHPTEAVVVQGSYTTLGQKNIPTEKTVPPDFDTTVAKKVSPPTKDFGKISQGILSEPTPSKTTGPRQGKTETTVPGPDIPQVTQTYETGSHYKPHPFTSLMTPVSIESVSPGMSTSGKNYTAIILAIVFSILLLVCLLAFLYCRHRRHSGSTNFNAPEWAGQAALPDDTGLDKDVEQEVGASGEGETRRGTLVTFFGKRQSRVPSIAMEDINGKGGKEETEQLLRGEAGTGSTSEAFGDANGKVPEPHMESSQESQPPIS